MSAHSLHGHAFIESSKRRNETFNIVKHFGAQGLQITPIINSLFIQIFQSIAIILISFLFILLIITNYLY